MAFTKYDILDILARNTLGLTLAQGLRVAEEIFALPEGDLLPTTATVERIEGTTYKGVFFTEAADQYMREDKKIQAIKEVRANNHRLDGTPLGLKESKEAVEARMDWMGWPYI